MRKHNALRLLSLALAFCMLGLIPHARADQSTKTDGSISKETSAHTQIYALTQAPGASYPYYGAKNEPEGGVLYGRAVSGGQLADGRYGPYNLEENANETIIGHYYTVEETVGEYSLDYWKYMYGNALTDGQHAFLVYLNFKEEGNACPKVAQGVYDTGLIRMFTWLNTRSYPVFVRVAGEMNVWTVQPTTESFIAAFRHVAELARTYAPKVAIILSPNCGSGWMMDLEDFYPGDEYVDWIGCSLYYNDTSGQHKETSAAFYGEGQIYGDPMLSIQQIISHAALHEKPIIITEGGSALRTYGRDTTQFAAERMSKAMGCLPMVYPQIKAIVNSDYTYYADSCSYDFWNNTTVTSAIRRAVSEAGVYRSDYRGSAPYLTQLSDNPDLASQTVGDIRFCAYTYTPSPILCTWTLDGRAIGNSSSYPYTITVKRNQIVNGDHTIGVVFSNGEKISYQIHNGKIGTDGEAPSDWAADEISIASMMGLIPDALYSAYTRPVTRAEFCSLAVRFVESQKGIEITGRKTFSDTDDINVQKAASLGVVDGMGDGRFVPNGYLTREQAAKVLVKLSELFDKAMPGKELDFRDTASISEWAKDYVRKVYGAGIMVGDQNQAFLPNAGYTREQSIVTMVRLSDYVGS